MLILIDIAHACGLHRLGRRLWQERNFWRAVDRQHRAGIRYWHAVSLGDRP